MADLGRQVKYGFGKETVFGTQVAATSWHNQLSFELNPMSEYVVNNSAYGTIVKTNEADVLRYWSEGSLESKITTGRTGQLLLGAFGTIVTTSNADPSNVVKNHTADINENINGQSFTLWRKDSLASKAYSGARFGEFSVSMELGDYVKHTAAILAKRGVTSASTPVYTDEPEFVPKYFTVKTGSSVAVATASSAVSSVESFTLTVNPNLEADWQSGSAEPYGFSSRGYDITFEMTRRYIDSTYEDAYNNGTDLAVILAMTNTDATIGTSARPSLTFTAPKFNITDYSRTEDLDAPITETFTGTIHYSIADAYAIRAVLVNTVTSY